MLTYYQISKQSFKESIRSSSFIIILALALFFISTSNALSLFTFYEKKKAVLNACLAVSFILSFIQTSFNISNTIHNKLNNSKNLLLLSKPISRVNILLGYLSGIMLSQFCFLAICMFATQMIVLTNLEGYQEHMGIFILFFIVIFSAIICSILINYLKQKSFKEILVYFLLAFFSLIFIAGPILPLGKHPLVFQVDYCTFFILLFLSNVLLIALGSFICLITSAKISLLLIGILFFLGAIYDFLILSIFKIENNILLSLSSIIPNWQQYWLVDCILYDNQVLFNDLWNIFLYTVSLAAFFIILGISIFNKREIKQEITI